MKKSTIISTAIVLAVAILVASTPSGQKWCYKADADICRVLDESGDVLENLFVGEAQVAEPEVGILGLTEGCILVGNAVKETPIAMFLPDAPEGETWLGRILPF